MFHPTVMSVQRIFSRALTFSFGFAVEQVVNFVALFHIGSLPRLAKSRNLCTGKFFTNLFSSVELSPTSGETRRSERIKTDGPRV